MNGRVMDVLGDVIPHAGSFVGGMWILVTNHPAILSYVMGLPMSDLWDVGRREDLGDAGAVRVRSH